MKNLSRFSDLNISLWHEKSQIFQKFRGTYKDILELDNTLIIHTGGDKTKSILFTSKNKIKNEGILSTFDLSCR